MSNKRELLSTIAAAEPMVDENKELIRQSYTVTHVHIYRIVDGKIREHCLARRSTRRLSLR